MAENQGVNGDIWNIKATKLLSLLGWCYIGDCNMDLPGTDCKGHGVDALMYYADPAKTIFQSCVVESKRYDFKYINGSTIQEWIDVLRTKLDLFYHSEKIIDAFSVMEKCTPLNLAVIMCWVHNVDSESILNEKIRKCLSGIHFKTVSKSGYEKKIVFLTNSQIIRLCSIANELRNSNFQFYYPNELIKTNSYCDSIVLTIEYLKSNIILADKIEKSERESSVFYFGSASETGYKVLYETLKLYNRVGKDKVLNIYYYETNDNFRVVKQQFIQMFGADVKLIFKQMLQFNIGNVPAIIDNEDE